MSQHIHSRTPQWRTDHLLYMMVWESRTYFTSTTATAMTTINVNRLNHFPVTWYLEYLSSVLPT